MNIKKLNNKGFVVSTILYTVLIAFLLFLAVTLSIFSSAISTVGSANKDLINASEFKAIQVKVERPNAGAWYENTHDILLKITSEYGIYYWPKDFGLTIRGSVLEAIQGRQNIGTSFNEKIVVKCYEYQDTTCQNINLADIQPGELLRFKVYLNGKEEEAGIGQW